VSVRELLANALPPESLENLRTLVTHLRSREEGQFDPVPTEADGVIRELALAHIRHIEFHANSLTELATLLAGTLKDPRRAFHSGQLNVAMMIVGRLTATTARVCFKQILSDEPDPNTPTN
jgi:hypothetical protein